ncbi:hypothetical protein pdam_00017289 [Pocillopora damicornis]|uniref:Sushi domain-containing protein n=1 Tax=Pocillopora damicornis TaxID=46731 RepID=A0A3M6U8B5_POCDA|nr:hypothetical protein pdam_00017289 [Pocillopora damicornis]
MTFHIISSFFRMSSSPTFIPNGFVGGSESVEGSQYRFSCKEVYSLVGANTLQCTNQGNWDGSVPTCLKDCPNLPSSIPNGKGNETGSVEGSKHHFTCDDGCSLVGQYALHCNNKGAWNGSVPVCLIGSVSINVCL